MHKENMTEIEDLTRIMDKLIHKSMSEVSKLSHIERDLTEQYNAAIKENRLTAGRIMHEMKPFESRINELYPEIGNQVRDAIWAYKDYLKALKKNNVREQ